MPRRLVRIVIAAAVLLLLAGCGVSGPGVGAAPAAPAAAAATAAKSLASVGGYRITLQAFTCPDSQPGCDLAAGTSAAVKVVVARATALGIAGASAHLSGNVGSHLITLDLPGASFDAVLKSALITPGRVEFIDSGQTSLPVGSSVAAGQTCTANCQAGQYKVLFTSSQLDPASVRATTDQQTGQPAVTFAFAGSAKQAFATYTRQSIGQNLTVTLDDRVIESATIQSEIDGEGQLTGIGSMDQARAFAAYMVSGPLPVELDYDNIQRVAPGS